MHENAHAVPPAAWLYVSPAVIALVRGASNGYRSRQWPVSGKKEGENMNQVKPEKPNRLTPQEEKLIRLIRTIDYGEVHIMIKENKPIRVEQIQRSIKLD